MRKLKINSVRNELHLVILHNHVHDYVINLFLILMLRQYTITEIILIYTTVKAKLPQSEKLGLNRSIMDRFKNENSMKLWPQVLHS